MKLALSLTAYSIGKILGTRTALELIQAQVQGVANPNYPEMEAVSVIRKLRALGHDLDLYIEVGSAHLAKCRSRALHWALESGCDAYVSVDDDCDADSEALRGALDVVSNCQNSIAILPHVLRQKAVEAEERRIIVSDNATRVAASDINITPDAEHPGVGVVNGTEFITIERAGFGLVVLGRDALSVIRSSYAPTWRDRDGVEKRPMFRDHTLGRGSLGFDAAWPGEDEAFWFRVGGVCRCFAVFRGTTQHAGLVLDLEDAKRLYPHSWPQK